MKNPAHASLRGWGRVMSPTGNYQGVRLYR
jgi:hypothetical protein